MPTSQIPKHRLSEKFHGEMINLWQIAGGNEKSFIDYAHRDDYYMFLSLDHGSAKFIIDFEEYEVHGPAVVFILPGQVHLLVESENVSGWVLIVDKMLVDSQCKEVFQCASVKDMIDIDSDQTHDLKNCLSMLNRRVNNESQSNSKEIIHSLLSSYIGMVAEIYQIRYDKTCSKRSVAIMSQFKALLSANYKIMKKPSQYAAAINISPIYLNEIVKKTMGVTVSASIHNEVIVQAKRLLFYTNLSVKEIALELGYEDWAYFTRLFTKIASLTPTKFRIKYLK